MPPCRHSRRSGLLFPPTDTLPSPPTLRRRRPVRPPSVRHFSDYTPTADAIVPPRYTSSAQRFSATDQTPPGPAQTGSSPVLPVRCPSRNTTSQPNAVTPRYRPVQIMRPRAADHHREMPASPPALVEG
jgi:hypothetical protein